MGEVVDLARRIHKRRILSNAGANQAQATAEALLYTAYDIEPILDYYHPPAMTLLLPDIDERIVTVVCDNTPGIKTPPHLVEKADVIVFAQGTSFTDCDMLGWLPSDWVAEAPKVKTLEHTSEYPFEVHPDFLLPMPTEFKFTPPNVDVLKIWDYTHEGWWTTLGFYIYDEAARKQIEALDA